MHLHYLSDLACSLRHLGSAALVSMSQIWDNACLKNVLFHPKALEEFRELPKSISIAFGESLRLLQEGVTLGMPASRPMPSIAPGVDEFTSQRTFRTVQGILFEEVAGRDFDTTGLSQEDSRDTEIRNQTGAKASAGVDR